MRVKWIAAGVLGTSAIAAASTPFQFYTVINGGDSIAGDQFEDAGQVVVGDGGVVGMIAELNNSGNEIVIYSTPAAGNTWNNQAVVEAATPIDVTGLGTNQQFETFNNLALTSKPAGGTRLTFEATDPFPSSDEGILQWDGNPSLGDVAFDGDSKGYTDIGNNVADSGGGVPFAGPAMEFQVNGSGQVLFPAVSLSKNVLASGDDAPSGPTAVSTIFTSTTALSLTDPGSRVALGTDNSGAADLSALGTPGIYVVPAGGGTPTKVSGSFTPISSGLDPLIGYASGNGISQTTLMAVNGSTSGTQDVVLSKSGGAPASILTQQFTPGNQLNPLGEMSPDGQIGLYIPDTVNGDTIQHADATDLVPHATVIASVAGTLQATLNPASSLALDPSNSSVLQIEALQDPNSSSSWVPQINDNGIIIFGAQVGTSPSDANDALLDWQPGDVSPTVVLADGDEMTIGGQPVQITGFLLNALQNENDFYKNALSDDGYLAIDVSYTELNGPPGNQESAVIITQLEVPEPASIGLISLATLGLLARRKRRE
jgi:hypothetical protein